MLCLLGYTYAIPDLIVERSVSMSDLSKAEQKRLAREEELIDLAVAIIAEQGPGSLTLEKLTARSDYSKGTIYNHFINKEDCLTALCGRAVSSIMQLFEHAMEFDGVLREKALALHYSYQLYSLLHPALFQVVLTSKSPGVREHSSEKRVRQMDTLELEINEFSDAMFRQALAQGEIVNSSVSVETMTFANWAMSFGSLALANSAADATAISRLNDNNLLLNNVNLLLDGIGWKPLSAEQDYFQTWQRIARHFEPFHKLVSNNSNND